MKQRENPEYKPRSQNESLGFIMIYRIFWDQNPWFLEFPVDL
jgi:hypothetical protein